MSQKNSAYFWPVRRMDLPFWLTFILSLCYMTLIILLHSSATSPIDEWVYLDFLHKVPTQGLVHQGEFISDWTQRLLACHGASPFGPIGQSCQSPILASFPNFGLTTGGGYYPTYFWLITYTTLPLQLLGLPEITSWRLFGLPLMAISVLTFWKLLDVFQTRTIVKVALTATLVISPIAWWSFSYVSTDAPVITLGLVTLYTTALVIKRVASPAWFLAIGFVAGQLKPPALLPMIACLLWITIASSTTKHVPKFLGITLTKVKSLTFLSAGLLLAVAEIALWSVFQNVIEKTAARADQHISRNFDFVESVQQIGNFLSGSLRAGGVDAYIPTITFAPFTWISLTFVLGAIFISSRRDKIFPVAISTFISLLTFSTILGWAVANFSGSYFEIPARYGAGLIGLILLCGTVVMRARWTIYVWISYLTIAGVVQIWMSAYFASLAP